MVNESIIVVVYNLGIVTTTTTTTIIIIISTDLFSIQVQAMTRIPVMIQPKQIITEIMGRELRVRLFPIIINLTRNTFSFYIKDPEFLALHSQQQKAIGTFYHVQRRDANTLLPIIWKHVYPGSTIWSDEWKAYSHLQTTYGYDHQKVNHSQNFIDPRTGCHTQLIESLWSHAKMKILKTIRGSTILDSHLAKFWYRSIYKPMFSSILNDIQHSYTK